MNRKPESKGCITDAMAAEINPLLDTGDLVEESGPVFLEGDQYVDIPANFCTAKARQLLGVRATNRVHRRRPGP